MTLRDFITALKALRRARSGVAMVEFALALPVMIPIIMYGAELAYLARVRMQVSQIAASVADNAARLGQTDNSGIAPTITADQVAVLMRGAMLEGAAIKFEENGRVILSSLEEWSGPDTAYIAKGAQFISWQRCVGNLNERSMYGGQLDTTSAARISFAGMGHPDAFVTAPAGNAVMYVEVVYNYRGLFGTLFIDETRIRRDAAFIVRDRRDLERGLTGSSSEISEC